MTDPLSPEDLVSVRTITDPQVSTDGLIRACVVHDAPKPRGESPRADIWVAAGDEPVRAVTSGPGVDLTPRLSPSGRSLAFASDRDQPGLWRLYVVTLDSDDEPPGRPRRIEALDGVVEDIIWASDESGLLVRTADDGADTGNVGGGLRFVPAGEQDAAFTVRRPATAWRRLHWVDLPSGVTREVGPEGTAIWDVGWAGHGPVAAVVSTDPSENAWYDAELALLDIQARTARTIHPPRWQLQSPAVSEDGRTVAVVEAPQSDRALLAGQVTILDVGTGDVERPRHDADVTQLRWTRDGRLFWVGVASVETACGFFHRDVSATDGEWRVTQTWRDRATLGRTYLVRASCSLDGGTVVAAKQAHGRPPELAELRTAGDAEPAWQAVTSVNTAFSGRSIGRETVHRWTSKDGTEIEGLLLLPELAPPDGGLPVVVVAHGGPTNASTSAFLQGAHRGDALLLVQAGCAVLLPNPRGSTGRGVDFMAANIGDLGGGDLADIETGVASLAASGLIDPARAGIVGLSYGGYMSAWAAVRSSTFAASVPVSGLMNWLSFHNTSNVGRFDEIFLDGDPYDPNGPHLERSPVMYVRDCRTPTLLLHGDADLACPISQAQEFYQGLATAGCETVLVTYKDAGHGMTEREQAIDVSNRIVDWFTRHLRLDAA